jgi:hypothetical protein
MPFGRVLITLSWKLRHIFISVLQGALNADLTGRHMQGDEIGAAT